MPSKRDGELIIFSAGNIQRESDDVNEFEGDGEGALVVAVCTVVDELETLVGTVVFDALFVSDMVVTVVEEEELAETESCDSLEEALLECSSPRSLMESLVLSLMSIVDAVLL